MSTSVLPILRNVKISFRLNLDNCRSVLESEASKVTTSYLIFKKDKYTFSIFRKSNTVNVTGLPDFTHVIPAFEQFLTLSAISYSPSIYIKIDNTTVNGQFPYKFNFTLLRESQCIAHYNPSVFPGCVLTLPNGIKSIIFKSGKYIIVGCKSELHINESFNFLCSIVQKLQ